MKRIEVLNLPQVFESLKDARGIGFAYALMKNKKIIDTERESLLKTIPTVEKYQNFLTEMNNLIREFCGEQKEGEVILLDKVELLEGKNKEEFEKKVLTLREENADAIKERRDHIREYQEFIKEDADVVFYKLSEGALPDELSLHNLLMLAELVNFEDRIKESIEITKYQLLTYTNIFRNMIDLKNSSARNKCLYNFVILRDFHKALYQNEIIQKWLKYETERKLLAESHASLDIFGDVLIQHSKSTQDDQFIIADMDAFTEALSTLNNKYETELTDFYNFINEKTTIDICKISEDELPNDLTLEDLRTLEIFIKN